jgi:nicotinamide mononucleotide (NMN) deamidase PncC
MDNTASAEEVAESARQRLSTELGLGIVAVVEPTPGGQHEGTITVALAGAVTACEQFTLRAMYGEMQRRSALNAADVLHRALVASPAPALP